MEHEDEDGNEMVYLDIEIDKEYETEQDDDRRSKDFTGDRAVISPRWTAGNARRNCVYGNITCKGRLSLSFR